MKSSRLITPSFHFIALSIWALSNVILASQALFVTLIGVLLPAILRLITSPTLHAVNPEFVLFHHVAHEADAFALSFSHLLAPSHLSHTSVFPASHAAFISFSSSVSGLSTFDRSTIF